MMKSLTKTLREKLSPVSAEAWLIVVVVLMMIMARSVMIGKLDDVDRTLKNGVWRLSPDGTIRYTGETQ